MRKKLVLAYVDSLRGDMLHRAVAEGRAPTFGRLIKRGLLIEDCVSSFPSVTPVASAEMVLIRLAYAADLPTPDEALRTLSSSAPAGG